MEVYPQKGPLALNSVRHALNRADVDWNPRGRRVGNQHCEPLHVHEDLAILQFLGVLLGRFEGLNNLHVLDLLLGLAALDFASVKSEFQVSVLDLMQFHLVFFAIFCLADALFLIVVLRSKS